MTPKVEIKNFKSIKHIVLEDCKRINLLIGRPNVGKSNILEAFAAFSLPYIRYTKNKSLQQYIRCENGYELFHNGNTSENIEIIVGSDHFVLKSANGNFINRINGLLNEKIVIEISGSNVRQTMRNDNFELIDSKIRSYFFQTPFQFENTNLTFLHPASGCNLFSVLNSLEKVKKEVFDILALYGLTLSFDQASQEIKLLKNISRDSIFLAPFNSIADTLQRVIFYKTAIASNENAIITFEEPEAHAYPPYISKITTDMIYAGTNQFFITTHSPYVLNDFIENSKDELAIYIVNFKDGQTSVKRLADKELNRVYEYGVDLFFNTEIFLK